MSAKWRDEFLTWNPKDYGGEDIIVIPAEKIWVPEVISVQLQTSAEEKVRAGLRMPDRSGGLDDAGEPLVAHNGAKGDAVLRQPSGHHHLAVNAIGAPCGVRYHSSSRGIRVPIRHAVCRVPGLRHRCPQVVAHGRPMRGTPKSGELPGGPLLAVPLRRRLPTGFAGGCTGNGNGASEPRPTNGGGDGRGPGHGLDQSGAATEGGMARRLAGSRQGAVRHFCRDVHILSSRVRGTQLGREIAC